MLLLRYRRESPMFRETKHPARLRLHRTSQHIDRFRGPPALCPCCCCHALCAVVPVFSCCAYSIAAEKLACRCMVYFSCAAFPHVNDVMPNVSALRNFEMYQRRLGPSFDVTAQRASTAVKTGHLCGSRGCASNLKRSRRGVGHECCSVVTQVDSSLRKKLREQRPHRVHPH